MALPCTFIMAGQPGNNAMPPPPTLPLPSPTTSTKVIMMVSAVTTQDSIMNLTIMKEGEGIVGCRWT